MDKYEKIRVVGRGGHGTVYLCGRVSDGQLVIMKQIPVDSMTANERQAALGEVRILQMLSHPNIIGYYENFLEENALCIVMQYAQGGTLADLLMERKGCLLEEERILKLFSQILLSIHHLHRRQILHRDLKTQNILLNKKRNVCKLSDFGISKTLITGKSKASTVVGTPNYLSPELCEAQAYNQKSDIWSLGCILYEVTTLKRAFEAETLPALIMKIMKGIYKPISDHYSEALRRLVTSMLHLDPEKRPTTAELLTNPVLVGPLLSQITEMGSLPSGPKIQKPLTPKSSHKLKTQKSSPETKGHVSVHRQHSESVPYKYQIFYWNKDCSNVVSLPMPTSQLKLTQAVAGNSQMLAVTNSGRVLIWPLPHGESDDEDGEATVLGSSMESYTSSGQRKPQYLKTGPSPVTIARVACGHGFTAFVTDRGMLLTCGKGTNGCLGHGDKKNQLIPKIVQDLISYSVTQIVCGASHVLALTANNGLYGWGTAENGMLGLGEDSSVQTKPRRLSVCEDIKIHSIYASVDSSAVVAQNGIVWSCGNNSYNKLGISVGEANADGDYVFEFKKGVRFPLVDTLQPQPFSLGPTHSALISGGCTYIAGNIKPEFL